MVALILLAIAISAYQPHSQALWFANGAWVLVGLPVIVLSRRRFRFTTVAYSCMLIYAVLIMIGAHFTYEHESVFAWMQKTLHLSRNHADTSY